MKKTYKLNCHPKNKSKKSCIPNNIIYKLKKQWNLRHPDKKIFSNNDYFTCNVVPVEYNEINFPHVYDIIKKFNPDLMIAFGSSIISEILNDETN